MTGETPSLVLVQGPGAIGLLVAARFARAGVPVTLLGRHGDRVRRVALVESDGTTHETELDEIGDASALSEDRSLALWVITTKAFDVTEALSTCDVALPTGVPVLVLSNGLGHDETLAERAPGRPGLLGTISCGARVEQRDDGVSVVHALGEGPVVIGPRETDTVGCAPVERAEAACALFARADFSTIPVPDGRTAQWAKAALNCGLNPVATLLGAPNGAVPASPWFGWAIEAARETAQVGRASGVDVPPDGWRVRLTDLCRATARNRCSMLQDLESGRRLEIDQLNGWVARRARRLAIPAPRNRRFADLLSNERSQALLRLQCSMRMRVAHDPVREER